MAVIYISHRLVEVFQLADRVTVLRDGRYVNSKRSPTPPRTKLIRMMVGHASPICFQVAVQIKETSSKSAT